MEWGREVGVDASQTSQSGLGRQELLVGSASVIAVNSCSLKHLGPTLCSRLFSPYQLSLKGSVAREPFFVAHFCNFVDSHLEFQKCVPRWRRFAAKLIAVKLTFLTKLRRGRVAHRLCRWADM